MDDLKSIPSSDKANADNKKYIDEAYATLFNSLGVEPGLLNKTSIGRNLNHKYKGEKEYAVMRANNALHELGIESIAGSVEKHEVKNTSPLYGHIEAIVSPSGSEITTSTDEVKDTLWQSIRKIQLKDHLTEEEVVKEISEYLERYASNYYIKKFLIK